MGINVHIIALIAAWLLDKVLGDPRWLPHPVIWFGNMVSFFEKRLNRGNRRILKGAFTVFFLIAIVFTFFSVVVYYAYSFHIIVGLFIETLFLFFGLAGTTLIKEGKAVFEKLKISLDDGRKQVSRIVGRDTSQLSADQVKAATLETLAENLSDGVIAPLFWYFVAGIPGIMVYKMVNTLDSMIGYKNERYYLFGRFAARLDDFANYIPARLTAILMVVCSGSSRAFSFIFRYGRAHSSPNAGYPEAALAGILNARFGGPNSYFGKIVEKPFIGKNYRSFTDNDLNTSVRTNRLVEGCMVLILIIFMYLSVCPVSLAIFNPYYMNALKNLEINSIQSADLEKALQYKLDQKTKPVGSLGRMEELAMQIGLMQKTTQPVLKNPVMLTVAADHGIAEEGVSPVPVEITWQQVLNFINGGGGIGLFCKHYGFELYVVDAGVNYEFVPHERLINKKVRKGSRNFLKEPAMTLEECNAAIQNGRDVVASFAKEGSNVVGFGEMGIANSSPATILLALYAGLSIEECTGPGCGLDFNGVKHKARILQMSVDKHGIPAKAEDVLATYGGLEIATIAGGMLEAARQRMLIIVDGFITTSAFMAAYAINPLVKEYAVFAHQSGEQGHRKMLEHIGSKALLNFGLRLGEGTGAAVVYPILEGSVAMLNQMTSFAETEVFNITE